MRCNSNPFHRSYAFSGIGASVGAIYVLGRWFVYGEPIALINLLIAAGVILLAEYSARKWLAPSEDEHFYWHFTVFFAIGAIMGYVGQVLFLT